MTREDEEGKVIECILLLLFDPVPDDTGSKIVASLGYSLAGRPLGEGVGPCARLKKDQLEKSFHSKKCCREYKRIGRTATALEKEQSPSLPLLPRLLCQPILPLPPRGLSTAAHTRRRAARRAAGADDLNWVCVFFAPTGAEKGRGILRREQEGRKEGGSASLSPSLSLAHSGVAGW